jgi:site-specific recombinase XerD
MEVKFFLKDKCKEKSSVRAIVRHKGQRYQIAVGESVITRHWNENKYRCRTPRDYPEASHINIRLDDWDDLIQEALNGFGLIIPTQKMVKDKIDEILRKRNIEAGGVIENEEEQYLVSFAEKYRDTSSKSERTRMGYTTTINKLKDFESAFKTRLRFIDIDINFYNRFKNWMLHSVYIKKKGGDPVHYTKNYIGALFKNITLFMNESKGKVHNFTGFIDKEFKSEKEETDSIYLTQNEIQKMYDLKITEELLRANGYNNRNLINTIKALNEERDRFLFGCFTALRHSDYSRLDALHFKDDIIRIWTVKKDKKVYIPMHYQLRELLQRRNNILPAPISDQKHNKQIKAIGKLAGINEEVILSKTRGGKRIETVKFKYEFITSHTARRSGATNMYLAGVDLKFIQDILGHSKIEQTISYIKVSAEDNAKRLIDHPYFSGKQPEEDAKKEKTPSNK